MHTYDYWSDYLDGGRKKYMRPLYEYGMRIQKANKWQPAGGDLQIIATWAGNFPFITVHNDDSFTLKGEIVTTGWGGSYQILKSQGVRYRIWKYTGIEVYQRNYQIKVIEMDPALTPSKIQGCRICAKTGKVDGWCNAVPCYKGDKDSNGVFSCPEHPGSTQTHPYRSYHTLPCEHGLLDAHKVKRAHECNACSGTGKRDYGNKPISLDWDGSPLRVKDRKIITINPLTQVTMPAMSELERMVQQYAG
jgi:hypothetical protein